MIDIVDGAAVLTRRPQASLLWEHCFELHTFSSGSLRLQFGCAPVQKYIQNFCHQEKKQNDGQAEASHVSLHAVAEQRKGIYQSRTSWPQSYRGCQERWRIMEIDEGQECLGKEGCRGKGAVCQGS